MSDDFPKRARALAVQYKASDYRLMAAVCMEFANKVPLDADRARMTDMAQRWLDLAQRTEAETLSEASQ